MRHLDEGTIHAWLDGALSADEAARADAHVASCSSCAEAVAEARGLIAASTRILTALDDVPNVKGAKGAWGAKWGRPSLSRWLVRERIAASVALVVAGGALAMALSRGAPRSAPVQMASESTREVQFMAADSPAAPPAVAMGDARKEGQTTGDVGGKATAASKARARDFSVAPAAPVAQSANPSVADTAALVVTTGVAVARVRTDDSLRATVVAQAERAEAREASAEAQPSAGDRLRALSQRRAAADAPARFAEPAASEVVIRGAVGRGASAGGARLVHEERMTEAGREILRRIYRVEEILVTLDERLPDAVDEAARAPEANAVSAAPAPRPDSVAAPSNTIRWTDARGAELTLTGPASSERLERIRKLLGY